MHLNFQSAQSPSFCAEVTNVWSYTTTPPCDFTAWTRADFISAIRGNNTHEPNNSVHNIVRPLSTSVTTCTYNVCARRPIPHVISLPFILYPTAFPYGNGMVLHFYQQQESSTTKTVHKFINKRLKNVCIVA